MNSRTAMSVAALAAVMAMSAPAPALADPDADPSIGSTNQSGDIVNGNVVQHWSFRDLKPSTDPINYTPAPGQQLWEVEATDKSVTGTVQPMPPYIVGIGASGALHEALWAIPTPNGFNPAPLQPGQQRSGKVYFAAPEPITAVAYRVGRTDPAGKTLITWTQPPPPAANPPANSPTATTQQGEATPARPESETTTQEQTSTQGAVTQPAPDNSPATAEAAPGAEGAVAEPSELIPNIGTPPPPQQNPPDPAAAETAPQPTTTPAIPITPAQPAPAAAPSETATEAN